MSYCISPTCPHPENPDNSRFCIHCGTQILLGDRFLPKTPLSPTGGTFLAEDMQTQQQCIIKQINLASSKEIDSFQLEVLKLQALGQHSQIPAILAYFEPGGQSSPILVQEYIAGQTLEEQLTTAGQWTETAVREFLENFLPILQFVHDKGIIHRDINPQNIIHRSSDGQLVLVDFSTAKIPRKTALAKTGTVIGSAVYTAPEQLRGQAFFASDIYSVGMICIHLLTQMHPFDLLSAHEGIAVWQDYLIDPIDEGLKEIINKMVANKVTQRYSNATEVLEDLNPNYTPASVPLSNYSPPLISTWQCIATLTGHHSSVHTLAFSPNGQYLLSGGADRTVKLWDIEKQSCLHTFSDHRSLVSAVGITSNQDLISGSWDYSLKIYSLEGELLSTLEGHTGWIHALAVALNGKSLVSGSADKTIRLWDLETKTLAQTLSGHTAAIHALAINPNDTILASGSADKTIRLWNLHTGKEQNILEGHSDTIHALTFSPSGKILISGGADTKINILNLTNCQLIHSLTGHSEGINCLAIHPQGNILVSGSEDKTLKVWHPGRFRLLHTLRDHTAAVTAVAISPDGRTLASSSQDKTIKLWQFPS